MGWECLGIEGFFKFPHVFGHTNVFLLIHGLELGVETANHHVAEAVALDACPAVHLVGRDVLGVASHIGAGVGVGSYATNAGHQLVIFVGNIVLCCKLRHAVNLVIEFLAQRGVGDLAVLLIASLNLVEIGCLFHWVAGAKLLGSLEHEVLQVVGESGGLGRVVA